MAFFSSLLGENFGAFESHFAKEFRKGIREVGIDHGERDRKKELDESDQGRTLPQYCGHRETSRA